MSLVTQLQSLATRIATEFKTVRAGLGTLAAKSSVATADIDNNAVTNAKIAGDAVNNSQLANVATATIKGRITAGLGDPEDLTAAQLRDNFFPVGSVIDSVDAEYTTNADLSATIPYDDTSPQVTEGTQILTVVVTPKSNTSRIRLHFNAFASSATATAVAQVALFRNGGANALAVGSTILTTANAPLPLTFDVAHVPGATTAQTYTVRVGANSGAMRLNGTPTQRLYGGAARAVLTATEIKA